MSVTARVEWDRNPRNIQRWITTTTGPSGVTRRKRHLSRKAAIATAVSFLTVFDERTIQARLEYDRIHRMVATEHEGNVRLETEPDK